jgi:hypothetical protein
MSTFETIVCLLTHARVEAIFSSATIMEVINEVQNNDRIPGWDEWLDDNKVNTRLEANVGRIRARAWGVSNPTSNFRSLIGARFRFRFIIRPDQIVFDQGLYRFNVKIRSDGRFLHTPAVPYPSDPREPPARTFSEMSTQVRMSALDQQGTITASRQFTRETDHTTTQDAVDGGLIEVISTSINLEHEMILPGASTIMFSVDREVIAAATGSYSDCRIRGSNNRFRFRVIAEDARIQKVLQTDDPCFDVLNP